MKAKKNTKKTVAPKKEFFFWQGQLFTSKESFKKYVEQTRG